MTALWFQWIPHGGLAGDKRSENLGKTSRFLPQKTGAGNTQADRKDGEAVHMTRTGLIWVRCAMIWRTKSGRLNVLPPPRVIPTEFVCELPVPWLAGYMSDITHIVTHYKSDYLEVKNRIHIYATGENRRKFSNMARKSLPSFDNLPLDKSGPPGNAWGLWGEANELGMLNLITPETVKTALSEVEHGIRISLDLPLDTPSHPAFDRQRFHHEILHKAPMTMNDDAISINTQSSTQWDGFRHYGYQRAKQFYGGHVQSDFAPGSSTLGIDKFAQAGGITGRGVLLDWYSWSKRNNIHLSPFQTGAVELAHLKALIAETGIKLRPADILFIRVGFTAEYRTLSADAKAGFPDRKPGGLLGLEATRESLRWLWENQFAAIASDAAGFERGPATGPYNEPDVSIHQWCLAGWGMPLGELFDLDELADKCRELGKWTFFLSSVPLKVSFWRRFLPISALPSFSHASLLIWKADE